MDYQQALDFIRGNAVMGYDFYCHPEFYLSQDEQTIVKWATEQEEHEAGLNRSYTSILR